MKLGKSTYTDWNSSDPQIVSVSGTGKVTVNKAGEADVTANDISDSETKKFSCHVTVIQGKKTAATGIKVSQSTASVRVGRNLTGLYASVLPEYADNRNYTWKSSDPSVLRVNADHSFTGLKTGKADLVATAEDGGFQAVCCVTVMPMPAAEISPKTMTLKVGETGKVSGKVSGFSNNTVRYVSLDPSTATVDSSGNVTAVKTGRAQIQVKNTEETSEFQVSALCIVTVVEAEPEKRKVDSVSLDQNTVSLYEKGTTVLKASILPEDATDKNVTWTTSDRSVVTVDEKGVITAASEIGDATEKSAEITVMTNDGGKTASCKVTVTHKVEKLSAVAPTCTETGLSEGEKCSVCGKVLKKQTEEPALGHSFGDWVTEKEATETETGLKKRTCSRCGWQETEEIPKVKKSDTKEQQEQEKEEQERAEQERQEREKEEQERLERQKAGQEALRQKKEREEQQKQEEAKKEKQRQDEVRKTKQRQEAEKQREQRKKDEQQKKKNSQKSAPAYTWMYDVKGWWLQDVSGTYPASQWLQLNGNWYYFDQNGYMETSCYVDGCWIGSDGVWNPASAAGQWAEDGKGWYYTDAGGWYPVNQWLRINSSWYYFDNAGYMVTSCYVDGCWIDANGIWNPDSASGYWSSDSNGWYYTDTSGWYPVNQWLVINGYWYYFDGSGYMVTNQYVNGKYWVGADGIWY